MLTHLIQSQVAEWAERSKRLAAAYNGSKPDGRRVRVKYGETREGTVVRERTQAERRKFYPESEFLVILDGDFGPRVFGSSDFV